MRHCHAISFGLGLVLATGCARTEPPTTTDLRQAICPPPDLFAHAMCLCGDFEQVGELHVVAGSAGIGDVGVNGATMLVDLAEVAGSWITGDRFDAVGTVVGRSLVTGGDALVVGDLQVADDVMVGGGFEAVGDVAIGGTLGVAGGEDIVGDSVIGRRGAYVAPAGPPCGCDPDTFFDVGGAVAAAAALADGTPSWTTVGTLSVSLDSGAYYVTAADLVGEGTIFVDGDVSVFVEGSLRSVGSERWVVAPGATLDLFVSGSVESVGELALGGDDSAAFRLYLGGTDTATIGVVGDAAFTGSIYAPRATVAFVGDATVAGALFAHDVESVGALTLAYGPTAEQPTSCDPPGDDGEVIE